MKGLLITLTSGIFALLPLTSEIIKPLKAQILLKSCLNYPYALGIHLRKKRSGSFRLISTSSVDIKIDKNNSISRSLKKANLRAKLNLSNFIKLTNSSKAQNIREMGFPIRINGRVIKTNSQLRNSLRDQFLDSSSNLKGVAQIAKCKNQRDYVMVTLEVTNETIRAAEYIKTIQ